MLVHINKNTGIYDNMSQIWANNVALSQPEVIAMNSRGCNFENTQFLSYQIRI